MTRTLLLWVGCIIVTGLVAAQVAVNADEASLKALTDGVKEITAPGIPGSLCVFGKDAFAVVVGGAGGSNRAAVVAASTLGKGRIIALGHDGYLSADSMKQADTGRLMVNAMRWLAKGAAPSIALRDGGGMAPELAKAGLTAEAVGGAGWTKKLSAQYKPAPYNVLVLHCTSAPSPAEQADIRQFIRDGGGLFTADTGWGWQQLNPAKTLVFDHPGNKLLAEAGLAWNDGMLDRTCAAGFTVGAAPSDLVQVSKTLDALEAQEKGQRQLSKDELNQATATVISAARTLPPTDKLVQPRLKVLREAHAAEAVPSPQKPLKADQPLARLALVLELQEINNLPVEKIKAHPAAQFFPGAVPAEAPRVTKTLDIDTKVPAWHSTGLYAAPGELIKVSVPDSAAKSGFGVRIGCHTDGLWHLASWQCVPEISRYFGIGKTVTPVASPFGGLLYIEVPDNCKLGAIRVEVAGAVEAPHFVLGKTDPATWRNEIRNRPAPWAELETRKIILSIPSGPVRTLDNPVDLMEFWDHVMDADAELANWPLDPVRAERYVADQQISAGYMHSGYPIMTFLDVINLVVDRDKLMKQGSWGHFHEMGHNHQSGDWTFGGTGEVTENLFSLYCYEKVCGIKGGHPAVALADREKRMRAYFTEGPKFEKWCSDPFLALYMYMQLQEAFGWEAYKRVFAEYRALPDNERPKNDDEKHDQWMVRFSRTVGRNLGPFFQAWAVPTSEQARKSIENLPVWMPESFPPK